MYGICQECQFFHPLCQKSVKYRKCLDQRCSRTHLKRTVHREYNRAKPFPPIVSKSHVTQYESRIPGYQWQNV